MALILKKLTRFWLEENIMSIKTILVPNIGDVDEVEVVELLVAVGDSIAVEDSLITVETDKASMEIPSSDAGVIKSIAISVGDMVKEGSAVIELELADVADSCAPAPDPVIEAEPAPAPAAPEPAAEQAPAPASTPSLAAAPISAGPKEILVPNMGDFNDVEIIEILVSIGDKVEREDSLITVETDKASMEIPSSDAGTVKEIKVSIGDTISEGGLVLILETEAGEVLRAESVPDKAIAEAKSQPQNAAPASKVAPSKATIANAEVSHKDKASPTAMIDEAGFKVAYASPSVRRVARELGVDLIQVTGTGRKQRIVKEDVFNHVKAVMTAPAPKAAAVGSGNALGVKPMPAIDFSQWGDISTEKLTKINKLTGEYLHRSWVTAPHVTQFDEADITEMEVFRKQLGKDLEKDGVKVTPLAFIIKAVVATLQKFPRANSSLDPSGDNLIIKDYYHIGLAVNTPDGLVVPVIRDADKKSLIELSNEVRDFAKRARDKKIKPAEMQGGTFTISSLGGVGGTSFTPIVNAPEVAILGVSNSKVAPVWNGTEFKPRTMLPVSLSYDHRVVDGVLGAQFTTYLCRMLTDIRRLLV